MGKVVMGSSLTSLEDAVRQAFDAVAGDPNREGLASAVVRTIRLSKGGVVGVTQFEVELEDTSDGASR
jgi:hypothetical protein